MIFWTPGLDDEVIITKLNLACDVANKGKRKMDASNCQPCRNGGGVMLQPWRFMECWSLCIVSYGF